MKQRQKLVASAVIALVVLGLAFTAVQAQEKSCRDRDRHSGLAILMGLDGLDKDELKALHKLDTLKNLKIRISGIRDLEKMSERDRIRVTVDIQGIHAMLRDLGRLGEEIERDIRRELKVLDSREFRDAMKALKNLKIDIEID